MKKKEIIEGVIAIGVLIGMIVGGMGYFAKAEDLVLTQVILRSKIVGDQIVDLSRQVWMLEDKYKGTPCSTWNSPKDRNDYRRLQLQIEQLKKEQQELIRKEKK